jgi:hypothetical protein
VGNRKGLSYSRGKPKIKHPLNPHKKTNPSEGINQEKNGRDPLGGTDFILDLYTNEAKKLVG